MHQLYYDGGITYNPGGTMTAAWQFFDNDQFVEEDSFFVGGKHKTNNVAEWAAVTDGLLWIKENKIRIEELVIYGDSKNILEALGKTRRPKAEHLQVYYDTCIDILQEIDYSAKHVRRKFNQSCDWLCKSLLKAK